MPSHVHHTTVVPWWTSCRLVLAAVGFYAFFCSYSQRVCMSVAILCMVNHTALMELNSNNAHDNLYNTTEVDMNMTNHTSSILGHQPSPECIRTMHSENKTQSTDSDGPFVWEKPLQGHILGAFFYGYLVSQIPGGLLAERFGGKWVFFTFLLVSTISTLLTPIAAQINVACLISIRILCGIGSGGLFPSMHVLLAIWSPPEERSKIACYTYMGTMAGNIITFPLSSLLCIHGFGGRWPSIFYVIGMMSVVSLVLWVLCVYNTPFNHPRITQAERQYITRSLKGLLSSQQTDNELSTQWLHILTSPAVWAIIIANIAMDWGLYTFLTNIPTYMYEVLYFDITQNGYLSALPFIGVFIVLLLSPILADKLVSSNILSVKWTRKLMNTTGAFGGAIFISCLTLFTCTQAYMAVAALTLGVAITGCARSGFSINHMDIAPRYAGTLFGIANCLASLTGFFAPYTAAVLTQNQTLDEWRRVFYISSAIYVSGGLFFLLFSQGTVQKWARDAHEGQHIPHTDHLQPLTKDPTKFNNV